MADLRLDQLPALSEPVSGANDWVHLQNVSNTAAHAQGTSEKAHPDDLVAGVSPNKMPSAAVAMSATDRVLGRATAGAGAAEELVATALGRALLAAADAAAARASLVLGSMATQDAGAVAVTGGAITGTTIDGVSIKSYVDNLLAGLKWKPTVVAASTAAGTLASDFENGDTLDGVVLATGNRILLKDQAAGAENGIYIVAASGAPTRATDADAGSELVNATVIVEQGTVNADKAFVCTNNAITLGVTAITFVNFAATITGALLATNNLSDLASASAARANLGLIIGTQVQAYDFVLDVLAGLATPAADRLAYFTSASAAAYTVFSAFARSLLDDADAAAARATLVLSNVRQVQFTIGDGNNVLTAGLVAFTRCAYAGTIVAARASSIDAAGAAVSGSVAIEIWAKSSGIPVAADKISASAPVSLSSASESADATLTGWTTAITANTRFIAKVNSATTVKQVIVTLDVVEAP